LRWHSFKKNKMISCQGSPERHASLRRSQHSPLCISDMISFGCFTVPKPPRRQIFPRLRNVDNNSTSLQRGCTNFDKISAQLKPRKNVPRTKRSGRRHLSCLGINDGQTCPDGKFIFVETCRGYDFKNRSACSGSMSRMKSNCWPQDKFDSDVKRDRKRIAEECEPTFKKINADCGAETNIDSGLIRRHRLLPQTQSFSCLSELSETEEYPEQRGAINSGRKSKKVNYFSPSTNTREVRVPHVPFTSPQKEALSHLQNIQTKACSEYDEFWGHFEDISSTEKSNEFICLKKATTSRKKYLALDMILEEQ